MRFQVSQIMRFKLIGLSLLLLATAVFVLTSLSSNAVAQEGSTAKAGSATKAEPAAKEGSAAKEAPTAEPMEFTLAEDQLAFVAPGKWQRVQPRSRILEAELKVPSTEADVQDGRITMMRAGGSIPENVARWEGQFAGSEGAETEKEEIAGKTVHFVNITGTFQDSMGRGPFAGGKKVSRENYQMRAAIVETGDHGNYFFKFIGPKSIVEPNGEAFSAMIRSMKLK
jgi:hypothetical protein